MNLHITVEMDRPITEKHYIVPGGFNFKVAGKDIEFDFCESTGGKTFPLNENKFHIYSCTLKHLDVSSFPESVILENEENLTHIEKINDIFIYTGELHEPEINVLKIVDVAFERNGKYFSVPTNVIEAYNDELHCSGCSHKGVFLT